MILASYLGLFAAAFGAATLLPLQSEAVLTSLLILGKHPVWALVAVATAGNSLGAVVNWFLGRYIEHWRHKPWFPVGEDKLARAQRGYHRYGRWSLLLSWMPVIGDPLTVIAGVMREPLVSFVLIVSIAKLGRYLVIAAITLGLFA
ncbi:MAG: Inner membrane protein YqaA [Syntrophorhabdus sp. PtaU1.Bin153]|nr:MAG: Inner membrane protein YqaA [Syntrophorhabdus sp. PtaU1.Bin153]